MSARRFFNSALVMLALSAAACGGGDDATGPGPTSGDVSGTYSLTAVRTLGNLGGGGNGLPVTFIDGGGTHLTFESGTLVLGADGTFDLQVSATFGSSSVTMTDYGSYSVAGSSITFNSDKSTPRLSTGSMSGSTLTANSQFGGIPFEIDLQK
ncbi:MAG TPA: hypothetical protein VFU46_07385 [Gemmatimonadales bacterium]|nr:hypothetical protein [Gemmatimonadales bacterium]